jgi:hypothetical protein
MQPNLDLLKLCLRSVSLKEVTILQHLVILTLEGKKKATVIERIPTAMYNA